jgi:hypothetical protein
VGKYYLDEGLIAAAGSDFYSVSRSHGGGHSPRTAGANPGGVMHQRNYTLAAFEFKDSGAAVDGGDAADAGEGGGRKRIQTRPEPVVSQPVAASPQVETPEPRQPTVNNPTTTSPPVPNRPQMGQLEKRILRFLKMRGLSRR